MIVDQYVCRKAFQEYLRKGTPIMWSIKQERPTTHYILRTRCGGRRHCGSASQLCPDATKIVIGWSYDVFCERSFDDLQRDVRLITADLPNRISEVAIGCLSPWTSGAPARRKRNDGPMRAICKLQLLNFLSRQRRPNVISLLTAVTTTLQPEDKVGFPVHVVPDFGVDLFGKPKIPHEPKLPLLFVPMGQHAYPRATLRSRIRERRASRSPKLAVISKSFSRVWIASPENRRSHSSGSVALRWLSIGSRCRICRSQKPPGTSSAGSR